LHRDQIAIELQALDRNPISVDSELNIRRIEGTLVGANGQKIQ
jgi:hypothetical protein